MAHSVTLNWDATPAGQTVTNFNVKRATAASGPFTTVGTPKVNTFVDTANLAEGQTYFYEVTAVNTAGESAASAVVSATIPFQVPTAPTGLVAIAT